MRRAARAMSRSGCVIPRATHRAITSAMPAPRTPASSSSHQCAPIVKTSNPTPRIRYTSRRVIPTANTMTDPSFDRIVGSRCRSVTTGSLVPERVADAVNRADEPRLGAILAQLPANARHVRIDHASTRVVAVAPDAIHQLLAAEDDAGLAGEREQDLELERGELHLPAVHAHLAFGGVDREPAVVDRLGRGRRGDPFDASQDRPDPDRQLPEAERLRQVVVRTHR